MKTLQSLEKLRECANHESAGFFVNLEQTFGLHRYKCGDSTVKPNGRMILNSIADKIEAEIERDYMRRPRDADKQPIEVGDTLLDHGNCILCNGLVFYHNVWRVIGDDEALDGFRMHIAAQCTHYHAQTVDDVLYIYGQSCIRAHEEAISHDAKREMLASLRKEFEMKLREVLENE